MSVEEKNKEVVRRVTEEVFNGKNMSVLDELVSPDYVYHGAFGDFRGREGLKEIITAYHQAFPDIHATIDQILAEGDTVAYRLTVRGTFQGEMMGIAPTGRQLNITEGVFIRFEDGKEAETFTFSDGIVFFQQLGIPFPER
ncbi:MAG TPA: ester cyclase [Dehalococcoidia bacterium]|nr:ester cyclase [Dehalococcoidia bacterium]